MFKKNATIICTAMVLLSATAFAHTHKKPAQHKATTASAHSQQLQIHRVSDLGKAVHINIDSAKELQKLKGVGAKRAQLIVSYRTKNGPFTSLEQLKNVKGIGAMGLAKIKSANPDYLNL